MVSSRRKVRYSGWPYGKFIEELAGNPSALNLSPVVNGLAELHPGQSLLEIMADYEHSLRQQYQSHLRQRSFSALREIANDLGYKVIGAPVRAVSFEHEVPFFGSSFTTRDDKKIFLSSTDNEAHARATIAHEIMHAAFNTVNGRRPGNLPTDEMEERLCDYAVSRLLVPENAIVQLLEQSTAEDIAPQLASIATKLRVPRRYVCMRLLDPGDISLSHNIEAFIEWRKRKMARGYTPANIVPYWSICRRSYIPWEGSKQCCHARSGSAVAKSITAQDRYSTTHAVEDASIGTLRGRFVVSVCAHGGLDSMKRIAFTTFTPATTDEPH